MQSMPLMGLVVAAGLAISHATITKAAAATAWSTSAAACVPMSTAGLFVTSGAVTAGSGMTVTLYCGITAPLAGGFGRIEITYKGGGTGGVGPTAGTSASATQSAAGGAEQAQALAISDFRGFITAELIELSKSTGVETVKCGIQAKGSSNIATESNLCSSSELKFNENFYYVRIVLKSGIIAGQQETIYGSSLVSR